MACRLASAQGFLAEVYGTSTFDRADARQLALAIEYELPDAYQFDRRVAGDFELEVPIRKVTERPCVKFRHEVALSNLTRSRQNVHPPSSMSARKPHASFISVIGDPEL